MEKFYAGIGSRETPESVRPLIHKVARRLNELGYTLRSGGADGADTFFEEAADRKEIFLPWKKFNGRIVEKQFQGPTQAAKELAAEQIYKYADRTQGVRKLLARNMHQVLGLNLDSPVDFIVCWTRDGKIAGGTAYAIRLGKSRGIRTFNLCKEKDVDALIEKIGLAPQQSLGF